MEPWRTCGGRQGDGVRHGSGLRDRSEGGGRQGRHALRRAGGGQRQGARDDAARELDLEGVVAGRRGIGERRVGRPREGLGDRRACPTSSGFRRARAPGLRARRRRARGAPRAIVPSSMPQRRRRRDHGEGVGGALAQLQVAGMRGEAGRPRPAGAARRSARRAPARVSRSGVVAGQAVERLERHLARARPGPRSRPPRRARRAARRSRTGGWRCRLAPAEHGVERGSRRRARRSRCRARACCRRWRGRRNRRSACAAAGCRRRSRRCAAAPRRRTAAPRRPRERRAAKRRVVGEIGIAHQRADADAAVRQASRSRSRPGRRVMSTSRPGRATPPFIRSSRLVPAAR